MFSKAELADLFNTKNARLQKCYTYKCCTSATRGFYCGPCRRLSQRMCRQYHILTDEEEDLPYAAQLAFDELKARLRYEYVFDIISEEDLLKGTWTSSKKREHGHQKRIAKLIRFVGVCV